MRTDVSYVYTFLCYARPLETDVLTRALLCVAHHQSPNLASCPCASPRSFCTFFRR